MVWCDKLTRPSFRGASRQSQFFPLVAPRCFATRGPWQLLWFEHGPPADDYYACRPDHHRNQATLSFLSNHLFLTTTSAASTFKHIVHSIWRTVTTNLTTTAGKCQPRKIPDLIRPRPSQNAQVVTYAIIDAVWRLGHDAGPCAGDLCTVERLRRCVGSNDKLRTVEPAPVRFGAD